MSDQSDVPEVFRKDPATKERSLVLRPVPVVQRLRGIAESFELDDVYPVASREDGDPSVPGVAVRA